METDVMANEVELAMQRAESNEAELVREAEWKELHWRLRSLAQQRVALEAQEAGLLLEAEETRLHRRLGYSSFLEYMERELHYGPHAANERLRVARELRALPLIAEQFKSGELSFSAVRELTRVATPENEHLFLTKAHGKTARDVERMVAGLRRGDDPEAKPNPDLIRRFIRLEVSAVMYARYTRYRREIDRGREDQISDEDLCGYFLAEKVTDEVTPPRVQVAVTTCKSCKQSVISENGEHVPIDAATAEFLTCDSTFIGDLESDELTRPKDHIPAALRRKVMQRDGFACVVPGCRCKHNLSVHHGKERQFGGQHEMKNMYTLCDGHHLQDHRGRLFITGDAPDLTFTWAPDDRVETATTGSPLEFVDDDASVPRGTDDSDVSSVIEAIAGLGDGPETPGSNIGDGPVPRRLDAQRDSGGCEDGEISSVKRERRTE